MVMLMKVQANIIGILLLSSAAGLALYWAMFLLNNLPRMARFGLDVPAMYVSTGVIGAVCVALFTAGIASVRSKPPKTLVLVRNAEGRVVSIHGGEYGRVTRGKAKASVPKLQPIKEAPQTRKHAKAKRLVSIAILAALVLGGYALSMALAGYTFQDVARGVYSPFMAISSGSMSPVLNYGDLIFVRKELPERIVVGDIIAFNVPSPYDRAAASPTVHRVVDKWVEDGVVYFKTMGDSNQGEDPWAVPGDSVIGKCVWKVPYVGLVVLYLRSPYGLALIVSVLAAPFIYSLLKRGKAVKEE